MIDYRGGATALGETASPTSIGRRLPPSLIALGVVAVAVALSAEATATATRR